MVNLQLKFEGKTRKSILNVHFVIQSKLKITTLEKKYVNNTLIASITPYFLEKGFVWFQEHLKEILESAKTQSFFQDNILFLEKSKDYNLMNILRKLDEMGYEKVFTVSDPGEFSQRGGVIEIFPVNTAQALRLDFLGNTLENIQVLDIKIENEEKSKAILQKKLKSQTLFSGIKNSGEISFSLLHVFLEYQ